MSRQKVKYRGAAICLALLTFLSSACLTMDLHYCQGEVKSFNLFGQAKSCQQMARTSQCKHHQKASSEKNSEEHDEDCCKNKTVRLQADDDHQLKFSQEKFQNLSKDFVIAFVSSFMLDECRVDGRIGKYTHYKPPLIFEDRAILHQTFLL